MQKNGCDFRLKTINEDFRVTEVSLLPDLESTPKTFTYLWIKKSSYTTFEMNEKIAKFFNLNFSDVVAEGLKDEDGITEQIISVNKKLTLKDVKNFNLANFGQKTFIKIERIMGKGAEPVRARALHGNAFQVVVRNLEDNEAAAIENYIRHNRFFSFINYYDNQRFGLPGGPYTTHLIGKAICEEKWDQALELLKTSGNEIPAEKNGKEAFLSLNPDRVGFYVSAYSSFLWNAAVSNHLKSLKNSSKFFFPGIGDLYLPTTSASDLSSGTFFADGFRFNKETFSVEKYSNGRSLVLPTAVYASNLKDDEIFLNKKRITLSFFLHTGCYATMMVKQIIKKSLEEAKNG